jgi:beta-lactamase regulating signal transducer with metallopeptidase domain
MIARILLAVSGSVVLSFLLKATVVLACMHLASTVATRAGAAMRHLMLTAGFAALLLLPMASIALPVAAINVTLTTPVANHVAEGVSSFTSKAIHAKSSAARTDARDKPTRRPVSMAFLAITAWLAGVALNLWSTIRGFLESHRVRRRSLPWHPPVCVREAVAGSGLRRAILLRHHPEARSPMTFGVLAPVIVVPPGIIAWSEEDLLRAMTHEIEHVRRYDWLTLAIARVVCAALWFHPLVWSAWRRMRLEAERACDDAVLRDAEPAAYADQLVMLARGMGAPLPFLAVAGRDDLSARIRAILDSRQPRRRAGAGRVASVVLLTIPTVAFIGAVRGVVLAQSDVPTLRPEFSVMRRPDPAAPAAFNPTRLPVQTSTERTEIRLQTRMQLHQTEHFVLLSRPELNANATAIGESAERAYQQIAADLGHDLKKTVPIVLTDNASEFPSGAVESLRGIDANIVLLPINAPEQVDGLLRHEVTHLFAFELLPPPETNGVGPRWVYEGLAEHERGGWSTVDEDFVRDAIRAGTVARLAVGGPVGADPRFVIAHAFFDYLQSEYGTAGIRQVLSALGRPGATDVYVDALHVDSDAVDRQFQRYLRLRFEQ